MIELLYVLIVSDVHSAVVAIWRGGDIFIAIYVDGDIDWDQAYVGRRRRTRHHIPVRDYFC